MFSVSHDATMPRHSLPKTVFLVLTTMLLIIGCSSKKSERPSSSSVQARHARRIPVPPKKAQPVQPKKEQPETRAVTKQQPEPTSRNLVIVLKPKNPLPSDTIVANVFGYGEYEPELIWIRNERELKRGKENTLEAGELRKGDHLKIVAVAGNATSEKIVTIGNQVPIFTKVPPLKEVDGKFVAELEGRDPDGDKVFLTLPAPVKGVSTNGMKMIVDPEQFGNKERTIPIALSDGDKQAGYLYRIHIKPVKKMKKKK